MAVVIVDAVRSPFVPAGGALSGWHPVSLLGQIMRATADRSGIAPAIIQRVIGACATPIGEQGLNIARNAVLAAGWPESVAAFTVDAQQTSGLVAFIDAVAAVAAGGVEVALAAGVESSSHVPAGASTGVAVGQPFGPLVHARYEEAGGLASPARIAEDLARRLALSRSALDAYAAESVERFQKRREAGPLGAGLVTVTVKNARGGDTASAVTEDPIDLRADLESLLALFEVDGLLTAATFARPGDGAAAVIVSSETTAAANSWNQLARVVDCVFVGGSPVAGVSGAAPVRQLLKRNGVKLKDVERFEVQETSAVRPLAFAKDLGVERTRINPDGGALAIGMPAGAGDLALVGGLAHAMAEAANEYGVAVSVGADGQIAATLLSRS